MVIVHGIVRWHCVGIGEAHWWHCDMLGVHTVLRVLGVAWRGYIVVVVAVLGIIDDSAPSDVW